MTPEFKEDLILSLRGLAIVTATGAVIFFGICASAYYIG